MADFDRESMLEMFFFEMSQLVDQLEQTIIEAESGYTMDAINEIFRIMHTIKGSAAMMMFESISTTSHAVEDLFYYLREENPQNIDYPRLTDYVLEGMDFVKIELEKINAEEEADGDGSEIIQKIKSFLAELKGENVSTQTGEAAQTDVAEEDSKQKILPVGGHRRYKAIVHFDDGCEMENIRAYTLVHNLRDSILDVVHIPADVIGEESIEPIRKDGFILTFSTHLSYDEVYDLLYQTIYLKDLQLEELTKAPKTDGTMHSYEAVIHFEEGCEMENIRSYNVIHTNRDKFENVRHEPADVIDEDSIASIRQNGFSFNFDSALSYAEVRKLLNETVYLSKLELRDVSPDVETEEVSTSVVAQQPVHKEEVIAPPLKTPPQSKEVIKVNEFNSSMDKTQELEPIPATATTVADAMVADSPHQTAKKAPTQHVISVNVSKLDQLLNLMGELVIAEAMVTQNPELEGLELESFHKEAMQLHKIINDVQDTVMSMRMVPLSTTFFKMNRIVRDMCKQLNKDVQLNIVGEETEVDKNIIEHIADPLMHIIRNSIDHGIEKADARRAAGKSERGTVLLEAKNTGGDVLIIVKDDGAGLNRDRIMEKAKNNGLLRKPENEYTDKEIHQFIFLPGFSTNEAVTSFSGRGVGMDVVNTNLEVVGGSAIVDSTPGEGSTFILKIPLTLAIIEGMTIKMGGAKYTIPIISIQQSFKASKDNIFIDPSGNEMITVRGEVYNVVRLYEFFDADTEIKDIEEGIMIMLENGEQTLCLMVDELIGEQQVVVKSMPKFIKKIRGISGCTLLGNGDISLIIDVAGFFDK